MIVIRHEFSEKATGYRYSVVAHEFAGETLEEARSMFHAHMKYDQMLRAVADATNGAERTWNGIQYRSVIRILTR